MLDWPDSSTSAGDASYSYAAADRIDNPKRYARSQFGELPFLCAWRDHRKSILGGLPPSAPAPKAVSVQSFRENGLIRTAPLLESLYARMSSGGDLGGNLKTALRVLVKKFEITNRIHAAYDDTYRTVDKNDYWDYGLHVRLGEIFDLAYVRFDALVYLNVLLKINDVLCAAHTDLDPSRAARLSRLIEQENMHVSGLAKSLDL